MTEIRMAPADHTPASAASRSFIWMLVLCLAAAYLASTLPPRSLDDDRLLLYMSALSLTHPEELEAAHQTLASALADSRYGELGQQRFDFRHEHRHNYLLHSSALALVRWIHAQLAAPEALVQDLYCLYPFGLLLGHGVLLSLLLLVLLKVRASIDSRGWALLGLLLLLPPLLQLLLAETRPLPALWLEQGQVLPAFLLRLVQKVSYYLAAMSPVGDAPRNAFGLIVLMLFLLRRAGLITQSYLLLPFSVLVHGSNGILLTLTIAGLDSLRSPARLREITAAGSLGVACLLSMSLDGAWHHFARAASPGFWLLPVLPLTLLLWCRTPPARALVESAWVRSLGRDESLFTARLCALAVVSGALIALILVRSGADAPLTRLLQSGVIHLIMVTGTLALVAAVDVWARHSPRRLRPLIPTLITTTATLLALAVVRPWPSSAPLADPGSEPGPTLSAALASPPSEHLDRLLYAAMIRQVELEEPAVERLASALREAAATTAP